MTSEHKEPPKQRIAVELNPELTAKVAYLVEKGIYKDNATFLEQAIQAQLNLHEETFKELKKVENLVIGWLHFSASDLERTAAKGSMREIKVLGVLSFDSDISTNLFQRTISKIQINGLVRATPKLKKLVNQKRVSVLGKKDGDTFKLKLEDD